MPSKNQNAAPNDEVINLLKKLLALQLFEMGVPQADIGKKLKMSLPAVNAFLKGIKKKDGKERAE
jgi:predicted transcriptional regulator